MRKRAWVLLVALGLMAGCSKAAAPPPPPPPAVHAQTGPLAGVLFPSADIRMSFSLEEAGKRPQTLDEVLLRDGDRVVAVQEGLAYATWHIRPDGVWRLDPKGGGTYLRYLPPEPKNGVIWHQTSGNAEVWFRLDRGACADGADPCWDVTVLNRGERARFQFEVGRGPVLAVVESLAHPAQNYTKRAAGGDQAVGGGLDRAALLKAATAGPGDPAPEVSPGTSQEFAQAAAGRG